MYIYIYIHICIYIYRERERDSKPRRMSLWVSRAALPQGRPLLCWLVFRTVSVIMMITVIIIIIIIIVIISSSNIYIYTHIYIRTCVHAYMHTCIHAYIHTCIYIYICRERERERERYCCSYTPIYLKEQATYSCRTSRTSRGQEDSTKRRSAPEEKGP